MKRAFEFGGYATALELVAFGLGLPLAPPARSVAARRGIP
jgi:hypothetical protein